MVTKYIILEDLNLKYRNWKQKEKRRHRRGSRDRDRRSRSKERDKKESKSSSSQPTTGRINLLETPMEIRKVLVVLTTRGDDVEFPEFLVKYTKLRPQLSYCENPRFATYHFMNRKEMLATVPHDIEEIIFKFLNSIRPKRLKIKSETKELEDKADDEVKGDVAECDDKIGIVTKNESDENEEHELENKSDLLDVTVESASKTNEDEQLVETEGKTEVKRSCKKLHRDWFVPWKTCELIPQYLTQDEDEIEIEEILQSTVISVDINSLSEIKEADGDTNENIYPSRKRNISRSSDNAVITEELEPIIRTAIRSKWDSDYEDSQDGFVTEKQINIPAEKDVTPDTNRMDVSMENITSELDNDNLGVVPMDIVEDIVKNNELEDNQSFVEEPEELEPPNVVEKLASEYEEFMKMVSFENKKDDKSVEDTDEVQDEYENSVNNKLNENMESNINKRQSFAEYLAEIGMLGNSKQNQSVEDDGAQIDKELWETKKLYFNRSRSASLEESDISDKENDASKKGKLSGKDKLIKKKNKKKKVQASKIKKKSKDKKNKKNKKKYSSSESSSSSSSSDNSSDESSSSDSSSSSSDSSSESSSSSSSDSSVDRKKLRKKKKTEKLKDKIKNKKNKKIQSSSSSEDDDDNDDDNRKKDKKRKKKKVEKKKKLRADKVKKLKDKKTKKKRSRDSSEEIELPSKKVKKSKKIKKKEEILNVDDSVKKRGNKKKLEKLDEKKHKEKKLEKEIELPSPKSLKRLSHVKEDSDVPMKKVRPEKDLGFDDVPDDVSRFFDMQYVEKSKDESSKFEAEIDEDFKKSKEYRRMKKRGLDVEDTDSLTKQFDPKSLTLLKKPNRLFQGDWSDDFDSHSESKQYFFQIENSLKNVSKERNKQDFESFDSNEGSSKKQHTEDTQNIATLKDEGVHGTVAGNHSKLQKDNTKIHKTEKKEDEDDLNSKTSSKKQEKKKKKEKKRKESDSNKQKKKKRKKSKSSPKENYCDSKDEEESVEKHIHFLRDENFLFELGKHKTGVGGTSELRKDFDEKSFDNDSIFRKSLNSSKLKNDDGPKSDEENSDGSGQPRNLEWHDDSETRASFIRRLQTVADNENTINARNSDLLGLLYENEDDESSSLERTTINASNSSKIVNKRDAELKLYNEDSKKKLLSSPLSQFPSFNIDSVVESDEDSINKEKIEDRLPSPDSSLGDIEIESQDNSFVLEKDLPTENDIAVSESSVKKGVFSEVSIKEMNYGKSIPDNFRLQEETFKIGTNDSDRYSPTLDLDLLSPSSLTREDKVGSDMSLDSNEMEDCFGDHKKPVDVLNMLDIPLPPPAIPTVLTPPNAPKESSTWNPPIPCPAPVPPPVLRPHLVATSPSFKNILNIPSEPPPIIPQVETKFPEPQMNLIRKEPIRLPLTNTRLTLNKPLVKVKPANIFDDDDEEEEEGNSLSKNLIDSPEKEVQLSAAESDSKFDESKKKRSRWGMEPEDELPIVKLYLASEVVKQTSSVDGTNYNESQTSKEISDDTSLFGKEKSVLLKKKFEDGNKIEDQIVNEERDIQSIDVSNIEVENAQEAWKDQENFNAVQEEHNSGSIELPRNVDLNKICISDNNIIDSITTVQNKMMETKGEAFDAGDMPILDKFPEEHITEEIKHDSKHEKSRNKSDESYRKRDYSGERSRSARRKDSSRDRRRRRDSSRDRRDYSRRDRSRSKEHRRDRSRERYRRDSLDRKEKKRDRSRERRRRDSSRDRKREKSPRRRDDSKESSRRREDSPKRRGDIKESPKRKDDTKEIPRKGDSKEQKPQIIQEAQPETETETSENEEVESNIEEFVSNIKEEPVDDGYEIIKENIVENKNEQLVIQTKVESLEPKQAETNKNSEELPPLQPKSQKIKINFKNPQAKTSPVPRKSSPLGFKRSLADSTSDPELMPVKKLIRTSVCLSPKRLSLDDRIELELGVKKSPPPPPAPQIPQHQTYYQIPVHDGSQLTPQVLPVPQQRRVPTTLVQPPRVDWDAEVFAPTGRSPQVLPAKSQVLQVGNILQVVPTEIAVSTPPAPPPVPIPVAAPAVPQDNLQQITSKVLQIGNMLQVVPTTTVPTLTPAQIFANAIANAVASVASSSPNLAKVDPSPVVKPTLPVAPVQPTISLPPPSPEEQILPAHTSPLLLPLPVAKKAINLTPVSEGGDTRRLEKEKRKREKEMRRQQKQKKATKKMIREALLMKEALESSDMENDDVRLSEDEATDEEEVAPAPDVLTTPVRNKFFSPLPPPPSKGILVSPGFREKPVLATKPIETRKVSFADGVHPGEGTSPSASEEHPHSPPPQPSIPKDKRYKKKKKKRKVKVRIIRVEEGDDDDDDDDDDGSPPPPPPGSPPPMFHYPPPPPGFMYAPPPSFTVLQGSGDGQTFAPVYQQHHSSTTTTHTTTVQFAPPPPPPLSKHARK